jgi:multiple sugar transport system permease protein
VGGASAWQRFRFITIPHLGFVILVATLLEGIWTFKHFDIVQVMTGGGPGRATELLATLIYKTSFEFFRFGPAAAMGMLVTAVLTVVAVFYVRLLRSQD